MVNKIIIGSHDTMTYLKPDKWYIRLFNFMADCQDLTLEEQLQYVDCVDLRVIYCDGVWHFAHGLAEYKQREIFEVMNSINKIKPNCYIRLILEKVKKNRELEFEQFKVLCKILKDTYPNFNFFGGIYKTEWLQIYPFEYTGNNINQFISSMQKDVRLYEKICPRAYAKRMNKINKLNVTNNINLFDFLEIDIIKK